MTDITLHQGMNYSEGMEVDFRIRSIVHLQDEKEYYVLEDPARTRHFIEVQPFRSFSLIIGQEVTCRITKINCTGRIILEPKHPFYTIGELYDFKVVNYISGIEGNYLIVEDVFYHPIEVSIPSAISGNHSKADFVRCRIQEIRKGIPELIFLTL